MKSLPSRNLLCDAIDFVIIRVPSHKNHSMDLPYSPHGVLDAIVAMLERLVDLCAASPPDRRNFSVEETDYAASIVIPICREPWTFYGLSRGDGEWLEWLDADDDSLKTSIPRQLASLLYRIIRYGYQIDLDDPYVADVAQLVADTLLSVDVRYVRPFAKDTSASDSAANP